jgi:cysteinyl-tRNA synthetase
MSKSLKNFISIKDYFSNEYSKDLSNDFRIFCLLHKYHSSLHYSIDRINESSIYRKKIENYYLFFNSVSTSLKELKNLQFLNSKDNNINSNSYYPTKPTKESKILMNSISKCKSDIYKALSNDFDTPIVMNRISDLTSDGHMYLMKINSMIDKEKKILLSDQEIQDNCDNNYHPFEPLYEISNYIDTILTMLGLNMNYNSNNNNNNNNNNLNQSLNNNDSIDAFVNLRSNVRITSLNGLKELKIYQKLIKNNTEIINKDPTMIPLDKLQVPLMDIVNICDFARNETGKKLGIKIDDIGDKSTWSSIE